MSASWTITSHNETETTSFGQVLAESFVPGLVVSLNGNLGAGKTRLVQAIAEQLGVDREEVTSPTFTLIQEYAGSIPVYHFDTYRLNDEDEFWELGIDEIFEREAVSLVEWGDRFSTSLPPDHLRIEIEILTPEQRLIRLESHGPLSDQVLESVCSKTE